MNVRSVGSAARRWEILVSVRMEKTSSQMGNHMSDAEKELNRIVDDSLARLAEHFECVEVFASRVEDGCTRCVRRGVGNWYARQGMAQEFIGLTRADEIAERMSQKEQD
jgi:hypothetical protein